MTARAATKYAAGAASAMTPALCHRRWAVGRSRAAASMTVTSENSRKNTPAPMSAMPRGGGEPTYQRWNHAR